MSISARLNCDMNKRAWHEKAGRRAESFAVIYLRLKGYHILERRYKTRTGEIDIIARKGRTLIFIEVKQRATLEAAQAAISPMAERRIMDTANGYMSANRAAQICDQRFDIIFVIGHPIHRWRIHHIKDAWRDY